MPTLMIVDDEAIFRKGLRHMISEMQSEWIVVDEAEDGSEAIEKMERHRPDFVITDIRMPVMNGIEMQYVMKERFPSISCIVMSGYSDFEYARESLRLGAKDYLTKPIVRQELYRILNQLRDAWMENQADNAEILPKESAEDRQAKERLRHHIIKSLLDGSAGPEELDLMDYVGIQLPHPSSACLITILDRELIEQERYNRVNPSLFSLFISQFIRESMASEKDWSGFVYVLSESKIVTLVNYDPVAGAYERLTQWARSVCRNIKKMSSLSITIGIGGEAFERDTISGSCHEAEIALLHRLVMNGERVLTYHEVTSVPGIRMNTGEFDWSALDKGIDEGDAEQTRLKTRRLVMKLCETAASPETVQRQVCAMLLHFYETAVKLNLVQDWLPGSDIKQVLERTLAITTKHELADSCQQLLGLLCEKVAARRSSSPINPIETVARYVDEHYDKTITLGMMADLVYLNPSYLSTLFKNKLGITFIDYVSERRIQEAKRLLVTTEIRIADIAKAAGFSNLRHFNRVFRSIAGETPKEYRDRL